MPRQNELLLKYKGVKIYHTYNGDEPEMGVNVFHYGFTSGASERDEATFDVRDLEVPNKARLNDGWEGIKALMRDGIDAGLLTKQGIVKTVPAQTNSQR